MTQQLLDFRDGKTWDAKEVPVGMVTQESCVHPNVAGSETPTGNHWLDKVRAGTIECQECGERAQMRCECGVFVCFRHLYEIANRDCCGTCVSHVREEMRMQDDLSLEMYKNITRRR